MDFKEIYIGEMIKKRVEECEIDTFRICNFFKCTVEEIEKMYEKKGLDSEILLKWCKILGYDFFRIYSQHLILYSPPFMMEIKKKQKKTSLPKFRKNIYTKEVIDFIFERIDSGEMTKGEVIKRYRIPKTTLYKWISKYKK